MIKTSRILSLILTLIIASASWTGAKAQQYWEAKPGTQAHVGDFFYLLNKVARTAIVTDKTYTGSTSGSNTYSSAVVIPETFQAIDEEDGQTYTYTVIGIDDCAFYGCSELISVEIPKTVTEIGTQVFDHCSKLQGVTVNPQNQYFYAKDGVLYDKHQTELIFCTRLKEGQFTVPSDIKKIHSYAFNGCKSITKVVLPNGLKEIGDFAFMNCPAMTSVNIPTGLTTLGTNAFRGASSLTSSIAIPATLTFISSSAFQGCNKISNVTIPEGITAIGEYAFSECTSLKSIELPTTINELSISAFENAGLTSINIPTGITDIPASAFAGCKLTSITLPEGLHTIQTEAFADNGTTINSVSIPQSVTYIGNNAFSGTSVQNFYINNTPTRLSIGEYTPFKKSGTSIHIFSLMTSIFENATNWSKYAGHFVDDIEITHVTSIALDKEKMTVLTNALGKLNATINPEDARVKDVVFTSSNENLILIANAATGDFVARANEGKATITCTAVDGSGVFAKCEIEVKKAFTPATSVSISNTQLSMEANQTKTLTAHVNSGATFTGIIWLSDNEDVATVEDGKVTAKAAGEATITAISEDGAARAKCKVTVTYGEYTLTDGSDYTGNEDYFVKKLIYSRTYKTRNWQTLYLPFDISYNDIKDNFDVAWLNNVHQFDDDDNGTIDRTLIEAIKMSAGKTIKANTPCIIRAKVADADHKQNIVVNNAILRKAEHKAVDCSSVSTKYIFYGTYKAMSGAELVAGNYYVLTSGGFREARTSDNVNAYRWYFDIKDRDAESKFANSKISIICIDEDEANGEATGIETIANDSEEVIAIYDINGRKQNEFAKGINIVKYSDGSTKKIIK